MQLPGQAGVTIGGGTVTASCGIADNGSLCEVQAVASGDGATITIGTGCSIIAPAAGKLSGDGKTIVSSNGSAVSSVTIGARHTSSGGSGNSSMSSSSDQSTGIKAEGTLFNNSSVTLLSDNKTGAENELGDAKTYGELKEGIDSGFAVVGAYKIKCASFIGTLTLRFPVDTLYNGKDFVVTHKTSVGTIETYTGTVKEGKVVVQVKSLSTFMLAIQEGPTTPGSWVNPFTDVTQTDWFYDAVAKCHQLGLMKGTSQSSFEPNANTTRAMIITVLYNMAGKPDVTAAGSE